MHSQKNTRPVLRQHWALSTLPIVIVTSLSLGCITYSDDVLTGIEVKPAHLDFEAPPPDVFFTNARVENDGAIRIDRWRGGDLPDIVIDFSDHCLDFQPSQVYDMVDGSTLILGEGPNSLDTLLRVETQGLETDLYRIESVYTAPRGIDITQVKYTRSVERLFLLDAGAGLVYMLRDGDVYPQVVFDFSYLEDCASYRHLDILGRRESGGAEVGVVVSQVPFDPVHASGPEVLVVTRNID